MKIVHGWQSKIPEEPGWYWWRWRGSPDEINVGEAWIDSDDDSFNFTEYPHNHNLYEFSSEIEKGFVEIYQERIKEPE